MLDIKLIRQQPEEVRAALARRGAGEGSAAAGLDRVIELDERRRALIPQLEELRARRNAAADAIAQAKRSGEDTAAAIAEQRELGAREKELARELAAVEAELDAALLPLPNLPDPTAAPGPEDELVRVVGEAGLGGLAVGGPGVGGLVRLDLGEAVLSGRTGGGAAGGPRFPPATTWSWPAR